MSKEGFTDDIDIIQGKSFIQKNEEVITDTQIIKNNTLTILNLLCIPQLSEGTPPENKVLKKNSLKNKSSIYTSPPCVHLLR